VKSSDTKWVMKPRLYLLGLFLTVTCLITFGVTHSNAQSGGTLSGRFKLVNIQVTQYIWQLLSTTDDHLICEVQVEHEGQPTTDELVTTCYSELFPLAPTQTSLPVGTQAATQSASSTPSTSQTIQPTSIPFDFADILRHVYWHLKETVRVNRTIKIPLPDMGIGITAPDKIVKQPYVTLTAYDPVPTYHITSLQGKLNYSEFICGQAKCEVPLQEDSVIEFWATSSSGDDSTHMQATIRVTKAETGGYHVEVVTSGPFPTFTDACGAAWGLKPNPTWASFPRIPEQLNTDTTLYYLAAKLITTGIVNASSCAGGGLFENGSPNGCGIETARGKMIEWQNQFDPVIWAAGRDVGVPPRLLKALVQAESQFWPGNTRFVLTEYGFGQLTQQGADVALRWDADLYQLVCSGLLYDCSTAYANLPPWVQATLAGGLLRMVNGDCPTCDSGIDLLNAVDSLPILARTVRANCNQVKAIIGTPALTSEKYDDMWKFTLVSYHSGYQCLQDAVNIAKKKNDPLDWEHVSGYLACKNAELYVGNVWGSLQVNAIAPYSLEQPDAPTFVPTFIPTVTPTITPTPVLSKAQLRVRVYIDLNQDGLPQPNEMVSGVEVQVVFSDGTTMAQTTSGGEALFDLTGRVLGLNGKISIPNLFRTGQFSVPAAGEMLYVFKLEPPVLPTALP
jgi:hypothetical protein